MEENLLNEDKTVLLEEQEKNVLVSSEEQVQASEEVEANIVEGTHNYSTKDRYIWPKEENLLNKLEWFQDQKIGLMMHWGLYGELGMVASWALPDKDGIEWSRGQVDWTDDMDEFKRDYLGQIQSFNPVRFRPDHWAKMAKETGFRYLVLTTKHHDGFCLWDTKFSDFKVTAPACPYSTHKYADLVGEMFDAFRAEGLGIGAYFSKADWHVPSYWNEELLGDKIQARGPSYNPKEHPELWQEFCDFTKNQVLELVSHYGPIDILWFDAGWVCKENNQDIDLGGIVEEARKISPDILSVDRTIGGEYENYVTPEQTIPEEYLDIPWESCLTIGVDYTYEYDDQYKPARQLVGLLIDIVAKGGNLILNLSPQPDGRIPVAAVPILKEFGEWLGTYGEAIYETRAVAPYKKDGIAYTKKENTIYAFYHYADENEERKDTLSICIDKDIKEVYNLISKKKVSFDKVGEEIHIAIDKDESGKLPIAEVLAIICEEK